MFWGIRRALAGVALIAALVLGVAHPASAVVYANITDVTVNELSNGMRVVIKSDGVLRWSGDAQGVSARVVIHFPGARSQVGKPFIEVNKFPVSGILLATPQDAPDGVGIDMTVNLLQASSYNIRDGADLQSVILTVNSDRTLEKKTGAGASAPVASGLDVRFEANLLSVRAVKVDIHSLLGQIAEKAGIDLAVDDAVTRTASLNLERLPVDAAMRGIASAYGLALSQVNGVYMISKGVPDDLAAYRLSGTQSFRMKYIQADTASSLLPNFLFQYVHRNSEQNAVVVTAPVQMLDKIGADLKKMDVAPPMIMIEALAVEVNSTMDLNAALGLRFNDQSREPTLDGTVGPTTGVQTASDTGDMIYRNIGHLPHNFEANLQALQAQGKARIHANPRMAAVNGRTASLFIGNQKFIQVQIIQYGTVQTKIQAVDVGVKLDVTPWTGGNGEITTRIEPEVSNIVETDAVSGLPVLSTRRASTNVRVRDGETIIIGGLNQRQETATRRKVPVLGDIPLIGNIFRSKLVDSLDTQLVIFVTPRILTETGHLPDAAAEEAIRKRMLQQP